MKECIVWVVEKLSRNHIRGQHAFGKISLKWWWTPWTYHFQHGGWILLNLKWLKEFNMGSDNQ